MARQRRGMGMSRPAAPAPRPAAPATRQASTSAHAPPAPAPASVPAPMQQSSGGGGMLSGIGSTIAQGMAFGTGSAIAHRAVGAVAGAFTGGGEAAPAEPVQQAVQTPIQQNAQIQGVCAQDKQMFYECLQVNRGDQQACSFLYEQLQQCQRQQDQVQFG
eukprot:CAMPEP_0170212576 /NCGR_PEP_ID=MMETSP0116_2-20130129/5906_1 /TAXON_ID=400756 /ORGANISM="Durinskia baltica, Strain CSIRO CS-38" /LENGTH=159 /DNA_ID=CAMNT_0010463115 /DNA_START=96 /DNA_END=575 /DNA_ORIENTATION=+